MTAEEQDHVAKGQVLVKLDDLTLKAQESQAIANKEFAAQNVDLAQVKLDQAQSDLERATAQLKAKIIPQEQYDHLAVAFSSAQTQCKIALAQQKMAEAQYATVETNLAHMIIQSPIDGVVAKKWTMPGNIVQPAQPIYTLYDLDDLWVEANFKETQITLPQAGRPGDRRGRRLPRPPLHRESREHRNGDRLGVRPYPARQRDGQLHQGHPAGPGEDRSRGLPARPIRKADPVLVPGLSAEVRVVTGAR